MSMAQHPLLRVSRVLSLKFEYLLVAFLQVKSPVGAFSRPNTFEHHADPLPFVV